MSTIALLRALFVFAGMAVVLLDFLWLGRQNRPARIARTALVVLCVVNVGLAIFLWVNHLTFPLNLDLMEGTVLQHFQRAFEAQPVYPAPAPDYVPLAYNPLFYYLAIPFGWLFGPSLSTLRGVAILGALGSMGIVFLAVREQTKSAWWGMLAVGLFAAAYRVMDVYLDTAHSDSWLLFSALLGTYLIGRNRSMGWNLVGLAVLITSFWFKQHGALFVVGAVLYLTWRHGLRGALPYWVLAALGGPALYILAGPTLFGSHFHYFTWEVPRQWSQFDLGTIRRLASLVVKSYAVLAMAGGLLVVWDLLRRRQRVGIWHFQFVAGCLSGLMGAMDPGSSQNVFIPMGTLVIILGVVALAQVGQSVLVSRYRLQYAALFVAFGLFLYNPLPIMASSRAPEAYADLVGLLNGLDGSVYAPSLGQLQDGYAFYPTAHWVALEDMIRGPGRDTANHPNTRLLLDPAIHPSMPPVYILANYPLEMFPWLAFLEEYYVLEADLGDRFEPLRVLPKHFDHGWPRYLYRYAPGETTAKE
jgi:hypothetical protein